MIMEFIEEYKGVKIYKSKKTNLYKAELTGGDVSNLMFLKKIIDIKTSKKKYMIMETKFETLNEILDSKEFNEMFNVEQEIQELEQDGWTLQEARKFAQFLIKTESK